MIASSWSCLKSLDTDVKTWGINKNIYGDGYKMIFESLLKRCGRYLTKLIVDSYSDSQKCIKVDNHIVNMIRRYCLYLQEINIGFRSFESKDEVETIKPIFNKMKKIECIFWYNVSNEELKEFFSLNSQLEYLSIYLEMTMLDMDFFDTLPQTITKLTIRMRNVPLHRICHVSLFH